MSGTTMGCVVPCAGTGQQSAGAHAQEQQIIGLPCGRTRVAGLSADPERSTTTGGWAGGEKGLLSFIQVSAASLCASRRLCLAC